MIYNLFKRHTAPDPILNAPQANAVTREARNTRFLAEVTDIAASIAREAKRGEHSMEYYHDMTAEMTSEVCSYFRVLGYSVHVGHQNIALHWKSEPTK